MAKSAMDSEFQPFFTLDGTLGLYCTAYDDICHSVYGALTEAQEKFILPSNIKNILSNKKQIRVLDICFGIGYNTKSFLNFFLENFCKKSSNVKTNIAPIHTDNILSEYFQHGPACEIENKNKNKNKNKKECNYKIYLDAVEMNKDLVCLSPFFSRGKKIFKKDIGNIKNEKIRKMIFSKNAKIRKPKNRLKKEVNLIILSQMIKKGIITPEKLKEIAKTIKNPEISKYFEVEMLNFANFYQKREYKTTKSIDKPAFLHNIYYRYVSPSYKGFKNCILDNLIDLNFSFLDARRFLQLSERKYDTVFLDAFSPSKSPSLWTFEFCSLLFEHLDDDGVILTYSKSASVRNAFIECGFFVGKTSDGTIASKNKSFIKNDLSESDLRLIKSKAGILYHDKNLSAKDDIIIREREHAFKTSNLAQSSKIVKEFDNGL